MTDNVTSPSRSADSSSGDLFASSPLEAVRSMHEGTLNARMGLEYLEASAERVVARMPVEGNQQPYGLLHGGASVVLAETVGSIGAALHAGPDRAAVGLEINATHHRGVRSGYVTATAEALSLGRTLAAYQVTIVDDEGNRVCTSRISCLLRDNPPKAR